MFSRLRKFVDAAFRRSRFEARMADEIRFHEEAYAADLEQQGLSADEARRRARLEFAGTEGLKEECRQSRGLRWLDELRQDLRYAARQMAKSPGFTAAAVLSLALGIGANTAIFSLMDAVLFRSLPVSDPEQLVYLGHTSDADVSMSSNYPLVERYQQAGVLAGITAYKGTTFLVRASSDADLEEVEGQWVSGNYHAVIGARFAAGRGFTATPDRDLATPPAAVISDAYWLRRFGRSPETIGRVLTINGRAMTIVGVTAPGFNGLRSGSPTDLTLPMSVLALDQPGFLSDRSGWIALAIVGRLRPGQTLDSARAEVNPVFRRVWLEPENGWARESPAMANEHAELRSASRGSSGLRDQYSEPLRILMAMVAVVLLVASANIANLLLARAAARRREVAVRLAIGASRARLVRQFLTESLLVSGLGAAFGLIVGLACTRAVVLLLGGGPSPLLLDTGLNARVLGFTAILSLLTGIGFGVVPAFRATRVDLTPSLRSRGSDPSGRRRSRAPVGKTLLICQIALSVVLVATAILLGRSLHKLKTQDTGFSREQLVLFEVKTPSRGFTAERRQAFHAALLERLESTPGVTAATLADRSPIDFSSQERRIDIPGLPPVRAGVSSIAASPAYFRTLGITLTRGREFSASDSATAPTVAIVSESMARRYFGDADPLGRRIVLGGRRDEMTIVGMVRDTRHESLRSEPPRTVYVPLAQPGQALGGTAGPSERVTAIVRTAGDHRELLGAMPRLLRDVHADAVVSYARTMDEQLDAALTTERLLSILSTGFGALALILAVVGLHGVMAYRVAIRGRETAIRLALGARHGQMLMQVLRETAVVSLAGVGIGLALTRLATGTIASFLFELSPTDAQTLATVAGLLIVTGVFAGVMPARRAAATEPAQALRTE